MARAEELIAAGRMRPSGLAEVETAKADGRWAAAYGAQRNATARTATVRAAQLDRAMTALEESGAR